MTKPLTPERETQIRALMDDEFRDGCQLTDALEDVLGELDRLRADAPCGARKPGWENGPAVGRHRIPCTLAGGHDGAHRDGLGQEWPATVAGAPTG